MVARKSTKSSPRGDEIVTRIVRVDQCVPNERKPRNNRGGRTGVRRQRATEAERIARIDVVFGLLVSGSRRAEICQFASKMWGIDDRQVDRYIAEATELIRQEAAKRREDTFAEHLAFRRQVRKRAMSDEDWRAALAAAQDEARLLGLYPAEKREVTGAGGKPLIPSTPRELTDDQLAAIAAGDLTATSGDGVAATPQGTQQTA